MTVNNHAFRALVKRGLEFAPDAPRQLAQRFNVNNGTIPQEKLETWQTVVLVLTPIVFYLIFISIQYTLFDVLPALVMIEQPTTTIVSECRETSEPDSPLEKASLLDEEVVVIRQEPMTRNIRRTIGYLQSLGGVKSRWRGFGVSIVYHLMHGLVMHGLLVIAGILPLAQPVMSFVCHMGATVVLCRLHMVWTHVVISPPSCQPWYRRVVRGRHVFKALALPSLKLAVAHQLVIILPAITFFAWGPVSEGPALRHDLVVRTLTVLAAALFVSACVLVPAMVHLTRVEASLLPADVDTIVSFDRSFGGRVAEDTTWSARYLAVMTSYTSSDRLRILKYYIKAIAILIMVIVVACLWINLEVESFGIEKIEATLKDFIHRAQSGSHQRTIAMMKF